MAEGDRKIMEFRAKHPLKPIPPLPN